MSEFYNARPWFRPRADGISATPVTWEGWLCTILLVFVILATIGLADPREASGPNAAVFLGRVKEMVGLGRVHLGFAWILGIIAAEIGAFAVLTRLKPGRSDARPG
jgi:hypothetical protein